MEKTIWALENIKPAFGRGEDCGIGDHPLGSGRRDQGIAGVVAEFRPVRGNRHARERSRAAGRPGNSP